MGLERIGLTALNAAQLGLTTTGHNIANVNTTGFHRQQIFQSAQTPLFTGAGFIGQGVKVDTIKRAYSQFLDNQVTLAQTQSSQLDTYLTQISQINNMLADTNAGLSPALQDFFSALNGVATNPSSVPSRQSLLSSGQAMVSRFQALNDRFQQIRDGVNSQITSSVSAINSYAQQIANLNDRINIAQASTNQPANDLLDQRDQLVNQLNQVVQASVVQQSDGTFNVYIGNGQPLVLGMQAFKLAATPSPDDPQKLGVGLVTSGGTSILPESALQGGSLGGALAFRSESLDSAQNSLGRIAIGLAQTFNDQHKLGQDLNDALGGNFFNVPTLSINNGIVANLGNTTATGLSPTAVTVSYADVGLLTTSDYKLTADGAGGFTLTRLSDGATVAPDVNGFYDGLAINLAAGAAAGESWTLQPTRNGARDISMAITDPTKVAAAAPILASASAANQGSATITPGVVTSTTNLPLPANVTLTYNSGTNQFTVSSGGTIPYTSGNPINTLIPGIEFVISGTPANGDTFTISNNLGGVSDNRNATLLAALQTTNTLGGSAGGVPTTTYQGAYSQLVSDVGNKTNEITVTSNAQAAVVTQTQQAQQAFSGVNLDEEAANLTRYQQAYQAAGQMISISNNLFQTLLTQIGG